MLTTKEMEAVAKSDQVDFDEILSGHLVVEDMDGYFRRELKENLLAQGYSLPTWLKNPDDDTAPVPDYLRERFEPEMRPRYDGTYDGGEDEETPNYGTPLYWQWEAIREGRFSYLKAYDFNGNELKLYRGLYGKIMTSVYDFLTGNVRNPISHKGYDLFRVKREELDIDGDLEGLAFVTIYLFPKN